MISDPKPERIELTPDEYQALRNKIYIKQYCCCIKCEKWLRFEEFSLHHKKTRGAGGDDSEENCDGYCIPCHPD